MLMYAISLKLIFFDMAYGTKKILTDHMIDIRDEPPRNGPVIALFDRL